MPSLMTHGILHGTIVRNDLPGELCCHIIPSYSNLTGNERNIDSSSECLVSFGYISHANLHCPAHDSLICVYLLASPCQIWRSLSNSLPLLRRMFSGDSALALHRYCLLSQSIQYVSAFGRRFYSYLTPGSTQPLRASTRKVVSNVQ